MQCDNYYTSYNVISSKEIYIYICPMDKRKLLVNGSQQFYEICDRITRIYQIFSFPEIPPSYYWFSTKQIHAVTQNVIITIN